jgi:hypothetical protein
LALLGIASIGLILFFAPRPPKVREIAVLFPGTTDRNWLDLRAGFELAAREAGVELRESAERHELTIVGPAGPTVIRWYPEIGNRALQRRVDELVHRPHPPIAVIGANNSQLTRTLAVGLANTPGDRPAPLLLIPTASADDLIHHHPGRAFRFGASNSRQASSVVERLSRYLAERANGAEVMTRAVIVQVSDDHFSIDLASQLRRELAAKLRTSFVAPVPRFRAAADRPSAGADVWTLSTSTGSVDAPSAEESALAQQLVAEAIERPQDAWVVGLPMSAITLRRVSIALAQAFANCPDRGKAEAARAQFTLLAGDTPEHASFMSGGYHAEEFPAPVIFFAHHNPTDPALADVRHDRPPGSVVGVRPKNDRPAGANGAPAAKPAAEAAPKPAAEPAHAGTGAVRGGATRLVHRDIARALLGLLAESPERLPTDPSVWAERLKTWRDPDGELGFDGFERRVIGGAILVIPDPRQDRFEIRLPKEWE